MEIKDLDFSKLNQENLEQSVRAFTVTSCPNPCLYMKCVDDSCPLRGKCRSMKANVISQTFSKELRRRESLV